MHGSRYTTGLYIFFKFNSYSYPVKWWKSISMYINIIKWNMYRYISWKLFWSNDPLQTDVVQNNIIIVHVYVFAVKKTIIIICIRQRYEEVRTTPNHNTWGHPPAVVCATTIVGEFFSLFFAVNNRNKNNYCVPFNGTTTMARKGRRGTRRMYICTYIIYNIIICAQWFYSLIHTHKHEYDICVSIICICMMYVGSAATECAPIVLIRRLYRCAAAVCRGYLRVYII